MSRFRLLAVLLALAVTQTAQAQESFRVELGRDGETIGDMRPVFLQFKTQAMPAISPVEVARRYRKLFDNADEPEVRIDALARMSNIQRLTDQDVSLDPEEEQRIYREAIPSYKALIEKGTYEGGPDELFYQLAKAYAFIGDTESSTEHLKQLVNRYPNSSLVPEARFRVAEAAFSAEQYSVAEQEYGRVISGQGGASLETKARYMQGWSQYKQGPPAWQRAAVSFLEVLVGLSQQTAQFTKVPTADAGLVEDTFRIVALMAADAEGVESIADWSLDLDQNAVVDGFSDLLYDRLADLYATRQNFARSVAVNQAFIANYPGHPQRPEFLAQSVEVWRMAGQAAQVRQARADYVAAFSTPEQYAQLEPDHQQRWRTFARTLADYHYDQGENSSGTARTEEFTAAAGYYSQLAPRQETGAGETRRLAGDAWLQSEQYANALVAFRKAAYGSSDYADAVDAGWAALLIERGALDGMNSLKISLDQFADSSEKWTSTFPADERIPQLSSDLANRLLARKNHQRARDFAQTALDHPATTAAIQYSALLVLGETHVADGSYGLSESAWRKALGLISSGSVSEVTADEVRQLRRQLATSIYRQGEQAAEAGKTDVAVAHFQRIDSALPGSDIAIKGRFDAANTLLQAERWLPAVNELSRFRQDYPAHPLAQSISEKLVFAYVSSGQPVRAADELMSGAGAPALDRQLRAAELYHQAGAISRRNEIYAVYLDRTSATGGADTSEDHLRHQRFRQRLIESDISPNRYREDMVTAELDSRWHSEETLDWSGRAALKLAEIPSNRFAAIELRVPLAESLGRKQQLLEAARNRLEQAQQLGTPVVVAQATFGEAELYRRLAGDLMASEAPPELNEMEAMQYQMLLEEEAFPFEEKAISLHETNHRRLAEGVFNQWVEQSLQVLAELFPGRYARSLRWMSLTGEPEDGA